MFVKSYKLRLLSVTMGYIRMSYIHNQIIYLNTKCYENFKSNDDGSGLTIDLRRLTSKIFNQS
jgi:hypothetical protein